MADSGKILLTGATGYVGGRLLKKLESEGFPVRCLARRPEFLKDKIGPGSRLSIVSAYFTIYAYEALAAELGRIQGLRFLFGEPSFITALDPDKTDSKSFKIEDVGLSLAHRLQQKAVARQCADWLRAKAEIRWIRQANFLHGKLYHIDDGRRDHAILRLARGLADERSAGSFKLGGDRRRI